MSKKPPKKNIAECFGCGNASSIFTPGDSNKDNYSFIRSGCVLPLEKSLSISWLALLSSLAFLLKGYKNPQQLY